METRSDQPVVKQRLIAVAFATLVPLLGGWRLDQPGIQNDEALFASVLYEPVVQPELVRILGFRFPPMSFPYIGTVKTAIYAVLFRVVEPSNGSVRWPMLLTGALTVYLFCRLLQRLGEHQLALASSALLVCDATFLFTIRCDWGPVAMQHLLAVAGFYCWARYGSWPWALAAGFCWGLGLWDKITFLWILFGIGVAALLTRKVPWRAVPAATLGFLLGAYPFIVYNLKTNTASFRVEGTQALTTEIWWPKAQALWYTLQGRQLFGSMAMLGNGLEAKESMLGWLVLLGLLIGWRARLFRFSFFALVAGFTPMALAVGGGMSPHHLVLLWPMPHMIAAMGALTLPSIAQRLVLVVVIAGELFAVERHYACWRHNGGDMAWTDAIGPLSERIRNDREVSYRFLDWGIYDAAYLLTRGNRAMRVGLPADEEDWTSYLYVQHPEGFVAMQDDWKQFREKASAKQLHIVEQDRIADSFGRPTFVLFRLAPNSAQ